MRLCCYAEIPVIYHRKFIPSLPLISLVDHFVDIYLYSYNTLIPELIAIYGTLYIQDSVHFILKFNVNKPGNLEIKTGLYQLGLFKY